MVGKFFGPQGYVHCFIFVYRFMGLLSHTLMCWTKYIFYSNNAVSLDSAGRCKI